LRLEEREEISRGIAAGRSIRRIAQGLGRSPSTISREIRRNGGSQAYRANRADRRAWERTLRPKPCRLALHRELRWRVAQKLALQWSPEQISGWLKQQFPTDQDMRISHEAIHCGFQASSGPSEIYHRDLPDPWAVCACRGIGCPCRRRHLPISLVLRARFRLLGTRAELVVAR